MSAGDDQVQFVHGVDRHGAPPPEGFPHRFAVLTWCTRDGEGAEPWTLLRAAVPEIARLVGADAVIAETWQLQRRFLRPARPVKTGDLPWADVIAPSDAELHAQATLPTKLRFVRNGAAVLWLETRNWHAVGGPAPYHDGCELSFFSPEDRAAELEQLFRRAAPAAGAVIRS